jgi:hypothetical protein
MKVLLTPMGPSDPVIGSVPSLEGLIPENDVTVLVCLDGKTETSGVRAPLDVAYYTRLFRKLCNKENGIVRNINLMQISFFDQYDLFLAKLHLCDIFFMAGFTSRVKHVEAIYARRNPDMTRKRHAVANRCVTNMMLFWGVCGSAVGCGTEWEMFLSSRILSPPNFQMLELLADGRVDYQACSGPACTITGDLTEWHITSGIGLLIVMTEHRQAAIPFCCVKKNRWEHGKTCKLMEPKLIEQVQRMATLASEYMTDNGKKWRLHWGTGKIEY